jgi:SAM-dependent methyltransferase
MERPSWAPAGIDLNQPSIARVYDCALGGFHNFAADRAVVERVREVMPNALAMTRANRDFLTRAVRYCIGAGIRQFLDIGSGIPTSGNVHEIARELAPGARVIYVDRDPVAIAHSAAILRGDPHAAVIQADLRNPKQILDDPTVRGLIDFDQPVALLLVSVLPFIPDSEDPLGLVDQFVGALPAGSYLVLSHVTNDGPIGAEMDQVQSMYRQVVADVVSRPRDEVLSMFRGVELVPPGLTWVAQWAQPDDGPVPEQVYGGYGGVGRKT